jgi:hypothetical protein
MNNLDIVLRSVYNAKSQIFTSSNILMIICNKNTLVNTKHELPGVQFTFILFNYSH